MKKNNSDKLKKLDRTVHIEAVRAAEGEGLNRFEISFSSEEPYRRWFGLEILDHTEGSIDMTRLETMGVVLWNHDRDKVIGKITRAWIEDGRGRAEIEFDTDEASEVIRKKVESGTLKGVSVGYIVNNWEEVEAGQKSLDGRFTGPCSIAKNWMPYEVSVVSIPADATVGVGRELEEPDEDPETPEHVEPHKARSLDLYEMQVRLNKNNF